MRFRSFTLVRKAGLLALAVVVLLAPQVGHSEEPVDFGCCVYYVEEFVHCSKPVTYVCEDPVTHTLMVCNYQVKTVGPWADLACFHREEESGEWLGAEACETIPALLFDAAGGRHEITGSSVGCDKFNLCYGNLSYFEIWSNDPERSSHELCPPTPMEGQNCFVPPGFPGPCSAAGYPPEICLNCAESDCCPTEV
ncbi:MAG: hypothetical protein GEEBNDBF_01881 [bacterium]|nr:hypothetical protein [bacterium]